jgi:hypothetical protein
MRASGMSLVAVRDQMRERGFAISHQLVNDISARAALLQEE